MNGQGSPRRWLSAPCWQNCRCARIGISLAIFALWAALVPGLLPADDDPVSIRLRLTWGGGTHRVWKGQIEISDGRLSRTEPLGLGVDVPGSSFVQEGAVHVQAIKPSNFGGVDFDLQGPSDALLTLEFRSDEHPDNLFRRIVPLADLIEGSFTATLDAEGNRIGLARVPGDWFDVQLDRRWLVFEPGESFRCSIAPRHLALGENSTARLDLQIKPARGVGEVESSLMRNVRTDARGNLEPVALEIPVPRRPGAYDMVIRVSAARQAASYERWVQFVVVSGKPDEPSQEESTWQLRAELDPTQSTWVDRLQLAELARRSGFWVGPFAGGQTSVVQLNDRSALQLEPGSWYAMPLSIEQIDQPHMIEVQYRSDQAMQLGISLLQPDPAAKIPVVGQDSGVFIPTSVSVPNPDGDLPRMATHRMVIWPRHRSPLLLFSNRHPSAPATIGPVKIFAGPQRLTESTAPSTGSVPTRQHLAYLEKPFFAENFAATKWIDPVNGQLLDDWQTFFEGADRMAQHLKAHRFSGAMITVACDGSALYPSALLEPTPKYDNGAFWSTGQDVLRKDVLEMLFRVFDREGLKLVATLDFSSPLPELENQRRSGRPGSEGIDLVDARGRSRRSVFGQTNELLPFYNPLDPQVQQALSHVVGELAERYHQHPSFAGVAIKMSPQCATMLPGLGWGYDIATVNRFLVETGQIAVAENDGEALASTAQKLMAGAQTDTWATWRAQQVSKMYERLAAELAGVGTDVPLYLAPVDAYRTSEARGMLAPSLSRTIDFKQSMLRLGWDTASLPVGPRLVLLQPYRQAPEERLSDRRVELQVEQSQQAEEFFRELRPAGQLSTYRASWKHFADLQKISPFGAQTAALMRLQPMQPGDFWSRQSLADQLRQGDATVMVSGGWLLPAGQEAPVAEMLRTFLALPDRPFDPVSPAQPQGGLLVIRQATVDGRYFFYALNPTPWTVDAQIRFQASDQSSIQLLTGQQPQLEVQSDGRWLSLQLGPFDLVAGSAPADSCRIDDYRAQCDPAIALHLRQAMDQLRLRINQSQQAVPLSSLQNAGFEQLDSDGALAGWTFDPESAPGVQASTQHPLQGARCLHLSSSSNIMWIRSHWFDPPETGRVSISVWLKVDNAAQQPPLRISLEGQQLEQLYYRFATVGQVADSQTGQEVSSAWRRFAVHFDDLPSEYLGQVRVGFDMMGPGSVYVDNVEIYDRWLDDNDGKAVKHWLAIAEYQLNDQADLQACRRILESYWPQFLNEYFAEPQEPKHAAVPAPPSGASPRTSSLLDRMFQAVPRNLAPKR